MIRRPARIESWFSNYHIIDFPISICFKELREGGIFRFLAHYSTSTNISAVAQTGVQVNLGRACNKRNGGWCADCRIRSERSASDIWDIGTASHRNEVDDVPSGDVCAWKPCRSRNTCEDVYLQRKKNNWLICIEFCRSNFTFFVWCLKNLEERLNEAANDPFNRQISSNF